MFSKKDIIIIVVLLALAAIGYMFLQLKNANDIKTHEPINSTQSNEEKSSKSSLVATVTVKGEEVFRLPLGKETVITLPHNPNVIIEVTSEGSAHFLASDCPDKVCIKAGMLSQSGQVASCLPNKTILQINFADKDTEPDVDITV